jgi:putative endonuclease
MNGYYTYIMASRSRVLYIGVTGSLGQRVYQHKQGQVAGFTQRYQVKRLVYYEWFEDVNEAIRREKQLKGWRGEKKVWLIERVNPEWNDLAESCFDERREESAL